ncbi:Uu.00g002730.m01.CDS01 [Anthostomella pinea]|uniref:Uu.00g002730.m01.CDS01 n=1 Tax=Anthostomella pinea TaxID=933095 RepID=A0AAI8VEA8_9PEZI|nr:Uu.00g002730.m01.CDS01 [Anthostomella pinea]
MSADDLPDLAGDPMAAAGARSFTIQLWTQYAVGVLVTILRTYARVKAVGIINIHGDDVLIWVAVLFYSARTVLGHSVGDIAHGLGNNNMTDAERLAVPPGDPEYQMKGVLY